MDEPWSNWRSNGGRREPVGRVDDCKTLCRHLPPRPSSFGAITSRVSVADLEFIAWKHGVDIATARQLAAEGKVKWQTR